MKKMGRKKKARSDGTLSRKRILAEAMAKLPFVVASELVMAQAAVAVANGALLMHPSPAGVDERYEFLPEQKRPLPLSGIGPTGRLW